VLAAEAVVEVAAATAEAIADALMAESSV